MASGTQKDEAKKKTKLNRGEKGTTNNASHSSPLLAQDKRLTTQHESGPQNGKGGV